MTTLSGPNFERWLSLCSRIGHGSNAHALGSRLESLYLQPVRAYHSLNHIAACLNIFDRHRAIAAQPDALEFSLWLHDCIYDPRSQDNEAQSAAVAGTMLLNLGAPESIRESVTRLILATLHTGDPLHCDAALIADIDLSILGSPPAAYSEYAAAIRTEYSFAPDPAYRTGRAAVLQTFLARPNVFHTHEFRQLYEAQARANLERELRSLT